MKKKTSKATYVISGVGYVFDDTPDAGVSIRLGSFHISLWPRLSMWKETGNGKTIIII